MPSLSAWRARSAESCSITSSSSARNIFDASSPSTCVSTTTHARTKLSRTSSPFHVPRRPRDALTQSLCSLDSTMTTGAPLDARRAAMPSYILRRDGICSQHGAPEAESVPLEHPLASSFGAGTDRMRKVHTRSAIKNSSSYNKLYLNRHPRIGAQTHLRTQTRSVYVDL